MKNIKRTVSLVAAIAIAAAMLTSCGKSDTMSADNAAVNADTAGQTAATSERPVDPESKTR